MCLSSFSRQNEKEDNKHSGLQDKKDDGEDESNSEGERELLAALEHDEYDIFKGNLKRSNPNPWYDKPYHSSLLEIACQMNRQQFVKLLLDKGADPNIRNRDTGMPLIHATARSGNLDVLKILLEHRSIDASVKDNNNKTVLHWLATVSGNNPGDKERLDSCFKLVQNSCKNKIIDWEDDEENTALYIAVKNEFQEGVLLLLERGADIMLSIRGTPILSSVSTPILEAILDNCLECNDEPETSEDVKLSFNYELLNKIVPHMAECSHQRELLKHPVTSCFINLHYVHITRDSLISILTYSMPLLMLTYAVLFPDHEWFFRLVLPWEAILISCFLLYSWCYDIKYFCTWEYFLSLPMLIYLVGLDFDFLKDSWIWPHMLVISFLLAWLKMVVMTGRLPLVAVQMEVFKSVTRRSFKYTAGFSIILMTSSLINLVAFKGSSTNGDNSVASVLSHAVLKTIGMFRGEFSDIEFDILPGTSHVIFSLNVFLLTVILISLLYDLAVGDIQELRRDAETLTVVARVRIIMDINIHYISQNFFGPNEMKEGKLSVYPNRWKPPFPRLLVRFSDLPCFSHCIRTKRQPSKKPQSPEEKLAAMEKKLTEMQEALNKIVTRLDNRE